MSTCKGLRIAILMINSPNIPQYAHKAALINYLYASKHGYAFIVERCPLKDSTFQVPESYEYLMVWAKPYLLKKHLPDYDYVLYIDSDAIVINQTQRVQELIQAHVDTDDNVCVVAARDCFNEDKLTCSGPKDQFNAGVLLFKNDRRTMTILDAWIDARLNKDCYRWRDEFPYEQACINHLRTKSFSKEIKVIPHLEMNGYDGVWIRHYMSRTNEERDKAFMDELNKLLEPMLTTTTPPPPPPSTTTAPPVVEGFHQGRGEVNNTPVWWWLLMAAILGAVLVAVVLTLPKAT